MAIPFLTGQRLTADLLNTNLIDYMPQTFLKTATTARTSTTTPTDDPELQGIPLSVGTWEIELLGMFTTSASNVPGLRINWAFSGTWGTTANRTSIGPGNTNVANPSGATPTSTRAWTLGTIAEYRTGAGTGAFAQFREISRVVVVSVAGNLSAQWAQFTSDATPTELRAGSTFTIRKII